MMIVPENGLDASLLTKASTGDQEYKIDFHIVFQNIFLPQK